MSYESEYEDEEDVDVVLEMLREDLIGELQAINQYQEHIDSIDDEEVIKVLEHLRDEEKEHVAELTKLIRKLDPIQAEMFKREGL
ncbi:MAG: demethoxyubiquinone hydroxylase family protein [Chloroflexota bacterium]|nr:demethoxyubiquinone hydroxylase family protein [Chloroflexota bacterium]